MPYGCFMSKNKYVLFISKPAANVKYYVLFILCRNSPYKDSSVICFYFAKYIPGSARGSSDEELKELT
jgi:hypothetical protein